jgi:hypothetical protein
MAAELRLERCRGGASLRFRAEPYPTFRVSLLPILMRAYVLRVLALALATSAVIVLLNWIVDPYAPANGGVSSDSVRMVQARGVRSSPPRTLLLGTSRTHIGLDPQHPALGGRAFSLAAPAQPAEEAALILAKLADRKDLRRVVWGLDFEVFDYWCALPQDFDPTRFDRSDAAGTLASMATFEASLRVLYFRIAGEEPFARILPDGRMAFNERQWGKDGGHHKVSLESEKAYLANLAGGFRRECANPPALENFQRLLRLAYQRKLDLRLLISPSHARQWETLYRAGLWTAWQDWKRSLLRINAEEAARAGAEPFPLWDFSGYTTLTTEAFPPAGDVQSRMRWYWESSHYRKELGDLVLDRIFGYVSPERAVPADFGVELNERSIEAHLAWIRQGRERWVKDFPQDAAEIAAAASALHPRRIDRKAVVAAANR